MTQDDSDGAVSSSSSELGIYAGAWCFGTSVPPMAFSRVSHFASLVDAACQHLEAREHQRVIQDVICTPSGCAMYHSLQPVCFAPIYIYPYLSISFWPSRGNILWPHPLRRSVSKGDLKKIRQLWLLKEHEKVFVCASRSWRVMTCWLLTPGIFGFCGQIAACICLHSFAFGKSSTGCLFPSNIAWNNEWYWNACIIRV